MRLSGFQSVCVCVCERETERDDDTCTACYTHIHVDTPSLSYAPCVNQSWRKNPQSHPKIFPYARDEKTKSEKKKNFSPRTPFLSPARTSPSGRTKIADCQTFTGALEAGVDNAVIMGSHSS